MRVGVAIVIAGGLGVLVGFAIPYPASQRLDELRRAQWALGAGPDVRISTVDRELVKFWEFNVKRAELDIARASARIEEIRTEAQQAQREIGEFKASGSFAAAAVRQSYVDNEIPGMIRLATIERAEAESRLTALKREADDRERQRISDSASKAEHDRKVERAKSDIMEAEMAYANHFMWGVIAGVATALAALAILLALARPKLGTSA